MRVISNLRLLRIKRQPVVLAAGFFDGLHRGHQRVINKTVAEARRLGGEAWVLTFDQHPMRILRQDSAPPLLTSNRHKLRLFEEMQVDGCLLMPFTRRLAGMSPEAFMKMLAAAIPTLARIYVGENWRFGHKEKGDTGMLKMLAGEHSIGVTVVRPVLKGGRIVSSTRIREEVACGNLVEARGMLGRKFSILGVVAKGRAVGRQLGFPTANLETFNEVLPPLGVYAVNVAVGDRIVKGVANIGVRPTFACPGNSGNRKVTIEVHLIRFGNNLYGREIEVFFVKKLRNEKRFVSAEELKRQIEKDVKNAGKVLKRLR